MTLHDAMGHAIKLLKLEPATACDFCWHERDAHPDGPCEVQRRRYDHRWETCECVQFETRGEDRP